MIGKTLIELRKKHGMSQQDLADKLHLARQTILNWENDQSTPSLEKAQEIAEIFDITLDELVGSKRK